uniref:Putative secreted protein n=1 Tax=Anopheles marajoara TaxID=58244 RepID=A0A2M4CDE5_9DIPT
MKYFFMRTSAISLLFAMSTAKTRFRILEQLLWMAETIVSRTAGARGSIRTECVMKLNGLFDTSRWSHLSLTSR